MGLTSSIVEVTEDNLCRYPQVICFINEKHPCHKLKIDWLKKRFKEGLRIKLLFLADEKKPVGFIEYVPGEKCWRAISASGYMVIHCLWINGKKYHNKGLGTRLIEEVERDAAEMKGVAVVTSDNSFMAEQKLFIKNGYQIAEESGKDQLLYKSFGNNTPPIINDWRSVLKKCKGLKIFYSAQCPWVARFIEEVQPILKEENLKPEIIEADNPKEAQNAPSLYASFNLIFNGKLLADRYISTTRFRNIIKNDIKNRTV